ncbi:hypothetical protein NMG60_11032345 [Bertholletia excelsa]
MKTLFPSTSTSTSTSILQKVPFLIISSSLQIFHNLCHQSSAPPPPIAPETGFLPLTRINYLLNAAVKTKNIKHAIQIHTQIIINDYLSFPFLLNSLLTLYAKCGQIKQSLTLFSTTDVESKNVITWTSLISQLSHHNKPLQALNFFNQMRRVGVSPNHFTFSAVLPACAETMILFHGEQVHSLICKDGYEFNIFVASALVDMYAKCAIMTAAEKVFDRMPERNLVSWNSMIVGFLRNQMPDKTFGLLKETIRERLSPDQVSFSSALSACAIMGIAHNGRQVHGAVIKHGLITFAYVKNSLIDMYCKCGALEDAVKLFQTAGDRDAVTWNVMAMGFAQDGKFEEACNHFWIMRIEGVSPDEGSFSIAMHAAATLAALDQGTLIHGQIIKTGFEINTCVTNSLITMYAKCGSLFDACQVFDESEYRNVVSWTAMISACQQHGCAEREIELFDEMLEEGIKPNYITFVCVLSACGHTGRVEEGFAYFKSMTETYNMSPGYEHYACMVDLLGRAGRLHEAKKFVESMPFEPNASVWGALLGACRNHGDLEMGRQVADRLFEIEPYNPGNYVLLSNMYQRCGRLEEADEVRRLMGINMVRKEPGCSWIDVQNKTFVFTAHDRSHCMANEIYEIIGKLRELVEKKGYAEEHKGQSLWYHSEKLALAFGLLILPVGSPIRIKKNLRTCDDCHTVLKFSSEIFNREIIVRDINRFHRFAGGLCSCRDYW